MKITKGTILAGWGLSTRLTGRFETVLFGAGTDVEPWPYVEQLIRFYREDRLASRDGEHDYLEALAKVNGPVLAVSSTGDTLLARPTAVSRFMGCLSRARVSHRVVTATDIDPPPDHMGLVTREASRPLWLEIAGWMADVSTTPPRPTAAH